MAPSMVGGISNDSGGSGVDAIGVPENEQVVPVEDGQSEKQSATQPETQNETPPTNDEQPAPEVTPVADPPTVAEEFAPSESVEDGVRFEATVQDVTTNPDDEKTEIKMDVDLASPVSPISDITTGNSLEELHQACLATYNQKLAAILNKWGEIFQELDTELSTLESLKTAHVEKRQYAENFTAAKVGA